MWKFIGVLASTEMGLFLLVGGALFLAYASNCAVAFIRWAWQTKLLGQQDWSLRKYVEDDIVNMSIVSGLVMVTLGSIFGPKIVSLLG